MIGEIRDELQSLDLSRRALRNFGLLVGGLLAAVAAAVFLLSKDPVGPLWWILGGAGLALAAAGLVAPAGLYHVYRAWMGLALVLGFFMTRILLSFVYLLVLTPIGLLLRAFGKDVLDRTLEPERGSYWRSRPPADQSGTRLEKYY